MLVAPASLWTLIARLRRLAMTWAAFPARTGERSSSKVTSRTQWSRFSIPQWPANVVGELGGADLVCGQRRDEEDVLSGAATCSLVVAVPGEAHCLLDVRKVDPLLCGLGRGFPGRGPPVFLLAASVLDSTGGPRLGADPLP